MSENDELAQKGIDIVAGKAEDIITAIPSIQDKALLKAALDAENAGKGRTTVVKALGDAITGVESPSGGDQLNETDETEARVRAEAEAARVADLERREAEVARREEAVSLAEAELLTKASGNCNPEKVETPDPTPPAAAEIDISDHVDMYLDEPHFEGGPTEALVHPDEVHNYAAAGWKEG